MDGGMTSPDLTPAALTAADRALVGTVTAILVTRGTTQFLAESVAAVLAASTGPDRLVVVDVAIDDPAQLPAHLADQVTLVRAPGVRSFGAAVDHALQTVTPAITTPWLWLLHDDCAPAPDALEHLLRALEHTSQVAVAGAKQVCWAAPDQLVEVGFTVARSGRRMTGVEVGELDQGQHDSREDVLAVGLTGALVRRSVWDELGGTVATYGAFGDGLDFCYRVRRAGHRVIVVPAAVVRHAQALLTGIRQAESRAVAESADQGPTPQGAARMHHRGYPDDTVGSDLSVGARLRSQLFFLAVTVPVWVLPFFLVAAVLTGPLRALGRIALKQPGQAVDELWAPLWLCARLGRVGRTRFDAARTATIPRRLLNPLMASTRDVLTEHQDRRLARRATRKALHGPNELDKPDIARAFRRRWVTLSILVAAVGTLTVVALGPLLAALTGTGRIVGGALPSADGGWAEVWQAMSGGWIRDGLGVSAPVDPLLSALAPVLLLTGGDLQLAVDALVVMALLGSAVGAWFAAGAATRSISLRVWSVLVWVAAPALLAAVGEGRLGAILVHTALPWFALALARGLGVQRGEAWGVHRPHASIAAFGAAALLGAIIVAGAPVLLVPLLLTLVAVGIGAPGHTRRLLVVPIPALALAGPVLVRAVATWSSGGWRILVGDPGLPVAADSAAPWQRFLGLPVGPTQWWDGAGVWGAIGRDGSYALGVVLVGFAVVGLLRAGARGTVARVGWAVAAIGLGTASLSAVTVVAGGTAGPVTGWPGAGVSLMMVGLLVASLVGLDGLSAMAMAHTFGWRQVGVAILALVVAAIPLAGLGVWTDQVRGANSTLLVYPLDRPIVPAVGQQMQSSGRQARVLILEQRADGSINYQLLHGDGPQLTDSSTVVAVGALVGRPDSIADLVARVASGLDGDQATRLGEIGVGAVLVPPSTGLRRAQLVGNIDMIAGIQRITENESGTIWRVNPGESIDPLDQPAWAHLVSVDATGAARIDQVLDADGLKVDTQVPAGDIGRLVVLAENAAPGWQATLDGVPLRSVEAEHQTFELGSAGGDLVIAYDRASKLPWLLVQGTVLLVFVLLALPIRRRRGADR